MAPLFSFHWHATKEVLAFPISECFFAMQLNPRHPFRRQIAHAMAWKKFFICSHRRYVENTEPDIVGASRRIANRAFRDFLRRNALHESMLPALEEYQLEEPTTRTEPFFIMIREAWKLAAAIKSKT
jgi:hypothetical protein